MIILCVSKLAWPNNPFLFLHYPLTINFCIWNLDTLPHKQDIKKFTVFSGFILVFHLPSYSARLVSSLLSAQLRLKHFDISLVLISEHRSIK